MDSLRAVAPGVLQTCNVSRDMTPKSSLLLLTASEKSEQMFSFLLRDWMLSVAVTTQG